MLSKIWKKVLLFVLIILCIYNITTKLIHRNSFKSEVKATAEFMLEVKNEVAEEFTGNENKN